MILGDFGVFSAYFGNLGAFLVVLVVLGFACGFAFCVGLV